jgi:DNA-binding NtrC family response regulator
MTPTPNSAPVVLLVEDDVLTRLSTAAVFEDAGFTVIQADNADEAVAALVAGASRIDALFTDIDMPGGMNGVFLAAHTREHWPWVSILMASGEMAPSSDAIPDGARFFPKPYVADRIVANIKEMAEA